VKSSEYELVGSREANRLLGSRHYLGPIGRGFAFGQRDATRLVAVMVWTNPTSRRLPQDGTWLELARWCLTPEAGENAGSRMHGRCVRWMRTHRPEITTLVSYSDPSQGHTGALYKACNWSWRPTWHRLRPPPSGNGEWTQGQQQHVKDRWVFELAPDERRLDLLAIKDSAIVRRLAVPA
jgi:hypothetical protein